MACGRPSLGAIHKRKPMLILDGSLQGVHWLREECEGKKDDDNIVLDKRFNDLK